MKKSKKVLLIILSTFVAMIAAFALFLFIGLDLKNKSVKSVNISTIPDGTYTGELTGSRFSNKLEVTVQGGNIVDIKVLKDMIVALPDVYSQITNKVMESQSLQVDSVAGATVSSKAYLKALEIALDGK